ncbi:hypothetical protein Tco_0594049 [Tanacetum coccineum]
MEDIITIYILPYEASPANIPTSSLGIIVGERIPYEASPANIPQRLVARERHKCSPGKKAIVARERHFMEYPDEVMELHKEKWISEEQRCRLALRILRAPENSSFNPKKTCSKVYSRRRTSNAATRKN